MRPDIPLQLAALYKMKKYNYIEKYYIFISYKCYFYENNFDSFL